MEVNVHEWQDKPFYKNYMLYSYILDSGTVSRPTLTHTSQPRTAVTPKASSTTVIPKASTITATQITSNGNNADRSKSTCFHLPCSEVQMSKKSGVEMRKEAEEKKDNEIMNEIVK